MKEKKNPILVIPDILAGGGSLIASVFEIYKDQTRQGNPMESVEVNGHKNNLRESLVLTK